LIPDYTGFAPGWDHFLVLLWFPWKVFPFAPAAARGFAEIVF